MAAILDETTRATARNTLAEIAFCLAFRKIQLAPELGRRDLFVEAATASAQYGMPAVIGAIGDVMQADYATRLSALGTLAQVLPGAPWRRESA